MVDIWREKITVRFGDVDSSNRLTLGSVFSFFQEAAISHAADLGVGLNALEHNGQAWILSRLSMFVERRPACGETVQISTWPREWEKLFALRDYEIRDEKGNAVVRGRGCWLVIDVERRRPLRIQPFLEPLPPNRGIDAFPAGPSGLNAQENPVKKTERSALYSDIDYYGHVNNARYIQWIQDATNPDVLIKADQARLDINYLSEVLPGETIEIWTAAIEDSASMENRNPADYPGKFGPAFAYEGRRSGTGQAVFRSELRT